MKSDLLKEAVEEKNQFGELRPSSGGGKKKERAASGRPRQQVSEEGVIRPDRGF